MSIGRIINNLCDAILPDAVGDAIGAAVDGLTGNWAGMALNTADLVEDVLDAAGAHQAANFFETAVDVAGQFVGGAPTGAGLACAEEHPRGVLLGLAQLAGELRM